MSSLTAGKLILFALLWLTVPPAFASDVIDCGPSLEVHSEIAGQVQELLAFMAFDHPLQPEAVESFWQGPDLLFWLHWSLGFQFSTEPSLYQAIEEWPEPTLERGWLGKKKTRSPSIEDYLRQRPSHDGYVRLLRQENWLRIPLPPIQQLDAMMTSQAELSRIIKDERLWRALDSSRQDQISTDIIQGLWDGFSTVLGKTTTLSFYADIEDSQKIYDREWIATCERLSSSLKDPKVLKALKLILRKQLPDLLHRRDDFALSDPINIGAPVGRPISKRYYQTELAQFKRYLLRQTDTQTKLAHAREQLSRTTPSELNSPALKQISLATPISAPHASSQFIERRGQELINDVAIPDLTGSAIDLLSAGRSYEKNLFETIRVAATLGLRPERDLLHVLLRNQLTIGADLTLPQTLAEIVTILRQLEENHRDELEEIKHLQSAHATSRDHLRAVLSALVERFSVESRNDLISEGDHLQDVLETVLPLEAALAVRHDNVTVTLNLLRTTLRNLYAFGLELATSPAAETHKRFDEILEPILSTTARAER